MLSIGEFSRVCGVTSRTLRYYDKINLIKPSHIDIASGYRFYDLGQLRQMLFINRLKSYDFSLEEIADLISIKEQAWLEQRLAAKQLELEQKAADYQQRRSELAGDLARIREGVTAKDTTGSIMLAADTGNDNAKIRLMIFQHEVCFSSGSGCKSHP